MSLQATLRGLRIPSPNLLSVSMLVRTVGPRAGINFNDGFGGGNSIETSLLFSFTRESMDHGCFNRYVPLTFLKEMLCNKLCLHVNAVCSWDRNMYMVQQPNDEGTPSVIPQVNRIHRNMMIGNYQDQEVRHWRSINTSVANRAISRTER